MKREISDSFKKEINLGIISFFKLTIGLLSHVAILYNSTKVEVCRKPFSILYAIKSKAIFRLIFLIAEGKFHCGIHLNRGKIMNSIAIRFFRKYYNDNYGYRSGRPQVGVCSTCKKFEAKIKSSTLNDHAKCCKKKFLRRAK